MTCLCRSPGRGQRVVQGPALVVREVITIVVGNQIDNRPLGQACRLIEDKTSLTDTRSETTHGPTVRVSNLPGNPGLLSGKTSYGFWIASLRASRSGGEEQELSL
jgi:hypothetical protein